MNGASILVTGGAGYVGSHTVTEFVKAGLSVVVLDNLSNASMESIKRVEEIIGARVPTFNVDLLNKPDLENLFSKVIEVALQNRDFFVLGSVDLVKFKFSGVVHFAGLKAVGESCCIPLNYYKTNVSGTINLLEVMKSFGVKNLLFSSSCTVYGDPQYLPLDEKHPLGACTNPYGRSKYFIEEILKDLVKAEPEWNIISLRYFNPIGAHESGKLGEDPRGVPNNLIPFMTQVAVGRRKELNVFGSDYNTTDGTCVRDYIHVVDLANGHLAAQRKLETNCGFKAYNLGTGKGYSVLEMVKALEKASGKHVPYRLCPRRPGDVQNLCSDPSLAKQELDWIATKELDDMCRDQWRWQSMNPNGYHSRNQSVQE